MSKYTEALKKIEKNPKDRIGILGHVGIVAVGAGGGAATASTLASIFGATTLLGSSTLGSLLGGVFVTTTPVGWVIGTVAIGGMAAYGLSRIVKSSGATESKMKENIEILKKEVEKERNLQKTTDEKISSISKIYRHLIELHLIDEDIVKMLLRQIADGTIDFDFAYESASELLDFHLNLDSQKIEFIKSLSKLNDEENLKLIISLMFLFKYVAFADGIEKDEELLVIKTFMKNHFAKEWQDLQSLYESISTQNDLNNTCKIIKELLSKDEIDRLVNDLVLLAKSDKIFHSTEYKAISQIKNELNWKLL